MSRPFDHKHKLCQHTSKVHLLCQCCPAKIQIDSCAFEMMRVFDVHMPRVVTLPNSEHDPFPPPRSPSLQEGGGQLDFEQNENKCLFAAKIAGRDTNTFVCCRASTKITGRDPMTPCVCTSGAKVSHCLRIKFLQLKWCPLTLRMKFAPLNSPLSLRVRWLYARQDEVPTTHSFHLDSGIALASALCCGPKSRCDLH